MLIATGFQRLLVIKAPFVFGLAMLVSVSVLSQPVPVARPKPDSKESRKEIRVTARNIAAEVQAPLTAAQLEIAPRVLVGTLPCELGQVVELAADNAAAGFFNLRFGKIIYRLSPQETTTGAIRLEDKAAGVVWLQLANKSMLMSQKLGKRLADECQSASQILVAEAMLKNPPPSVLDPLPPLVLPQPVVSAPAVAVPPDTPHNPSTLPPSDDPKPAVVNLPGS